MTIDSIDIQKLTLMNNSDGIMVSEFKSSKSNAYPIDGAIVEITDASFPTKKYKTFYEMIFVIEGEININIFDKNIILKKDEMFIIPPNVFHTNSAKYARVFVACTPPFNTKEIEYI